MSPTPVEELVKACRAGDRDAQRQLYERFSRNVYRLMVRMVGVGDADDLTQQVFLRVLRAIGQYSGRSRFETWLYRVAMNESLQHLRRQKRRKHGGLDYEPMDGAPPHGAQVEAHELLERGLQELDPELRSIFLLREVENLSYQEIAQTLEISEGTVASRLSRARRRLRERLTELGWEG